jgi:hypothetical protein
MSKKTFFVTLSVLFFSASSYADNTVNLSVSGNNNVSVNTSAATQSLIELYQVGTSTAGAENKITVSQIGQNDTLRIGQGALYGQLTGQWTAGTPVSSNAATVNQSGVDGLVASISQNGALASTVQATQAASVAYTLKVNQSGVGLHTANVETTSNYNGSGVEINQSGSTNTAIISGMSGGNAIINQSATSDSATLTGQSAGIISVNQTLNNSNVSVASFGSTTPLIINQ